MHRRVYANRAGLTIVEVLAIVVVVVIVGAFVIVPALSKLGSTDGHGQFTMETHQVRGLLQALVIHAQNNQDRFPLPSIVDANDDTIAGGGTAKDHTANIFSMLIGDGSISTEILISRFEVNPKIAEYEGYEFDEPAAAANPAAALWDPAFTADFVNGRCSVSYAHLLSGGPRRSRWSNTLESDHAVFATRGPQVGGVSYRDGQAVAAFDEESSTLEFFDSKLGGSPWSGMVGFADNHVNFEYELAPTSAAIFTDASGTKRPDLLHYNEPDDPTDLNAFLGIFTTAGDKTEDFTAIWD